MARKLRKLCQPMQALADLESINAPIVTRTAMQDSQAGARDAAAACQPPHAPRFKPVSIQRCSPIITMTPMQDCKLAREMQQLFASPYMRVNTTTDVTGVEICGALKNVLALAAGIVEGLDLGHNAMAALVAQARLFPLHLGQSRVWIKPKALLWRRELGL